MKRILIVLLSFICSTGEAAEIVTLLDLPNSGTDPERIDYAGLARIGGRHAVVRTARAASTDRAEDEIDLDGLKFQLHSYLVHHEGRYWCLWSEGPPIEDEPTQEVRYATSDDGLTWSESRSVTGIPSAPYAFIARGFWVRDGQLLALAAHFKGKGAFGADKELELLAYAWDSERGTWRLEKRLYENAINNFAPDRLPSGKWIMTRRDARFNVSILIGGDKALDQWDSFPVVGVHEIPRFRPDEPVFWQLPGADTLVAVYRDNAGSQRFFHATSDDSGRTWDKPRITNFPNATSKVYSLRTRRGDRILVSNANPSLGRREMHLTVSRDGRLFTRMAVIDIPSPTLPDELSRLQHKFRTGVASLQYPHAIEYQETLSIVFSRNKKQIELVHIPRKTLDAFIDNEISSGRPETGQPPAGREQQ